MTPRQKAVSDGMKRSWVARRERDKITTERDVLRCICDYLTAEGIWWMRCNSGVAWGPPAVEGAFYQLHAAAERNRIKLAPAGTADLLAIVPRMRYDHLMQQYGWAIPLWIEVKRPRKARRSSEQIAFAEFMVGQGCLHVWAKDVEDVKAVIPPRMDRKL